MTRATAAPSSTLRANTVRQSRLAQAGTTPAADAHGKAHGKGRPGGVGEDGTFEQPTMLQPHPLNTRPSRPLTHGADESHGALDAHAAVVAGGDATAARRVCA